MIKCGRPSKGKEQLSRDRLLDAALQLFLEYGYGNLSMETIARDARVSLRTIYNEFGGKAGLFGALIRRCSDQFIGSLSDDCSLEEALTEFGRQFLYRITRPDVVRMRAILIGESPRFPDLAIQFYEQGPGLTRDHLCQFFSRQQQSGHIATIEPNFLADQFISALRGERIQRLQLGLEPTPDEAEIEIWVCQTIDLFLKGCLLPGQDHI
ncbi:MAG: TetR/AcrR family transcriptional regulator [Methylococcaceae bacterium]|jgi:AcrR family transcriptional regulator|nr:TetR/AcrR family transcriptional regulator [Methylococcaceae bacterium]MDZ4156219.1 TetR/AcrR family transcriptional regulator [Methylococcales bacterium]MDP2393797.1 TetR/AcrR family transcriptional regulator [Methylococcaceae bacterium]MDP3019823.1 TetR/AcrR family transcriptional regulator [Methylococcaceae bacterium]MDP3389572.1 TetR/AcrR family transcriptional regulator [Methylococcaceae bacterium]